MSSSSLAPKRKASSSSSSSSAASKPHICAVCKRGFSTTGHLARHTRVHTGERNHKCPFPGCETRCSRQDNLQQHYRIHLSPGSRRKSGRSILRNNSTSTSTPSPAASPSASDEAYREESPPLEPPALEDSRLYYFNVHGVVHDSPPDTPPPLVEATYQPVPTHRALPQIDTSSGMRGASSARSSPGGYWPTQQYERSASAVSPASEPYNTYSTYQSPAVSPVVDSSYSSSSLAVSTSYSSLAPAAYEDPRQPHVAGYGHPHRPSSHSPDAYAGYENHAQQYAHPHRPVSPVSGPASANAYATYEEHYALPHRSASHSPAEPAVPIARSLATRHSIAQNAAHTHQPPPQHPAPYAEPSASPYGEVALQHPHPPYAPHPPCEADSPSPPSSSDQSPQTPYTAPRELAYVNEQGAGYAREYEYEHEGYPHPHQGYAADAYTAYNARSHLLGNAAAAGHYDQMAPVPAMQYHPHPAYAPKSAPQYTYGYPLEEPESYLHHPQPQAYLAGYALAGVVR
ncbi:hypothetical protein DFH09DRAFT_1045554 [Mycena vulgaris]|nr:hypothetical protein DFH09DRAFT_1045554 [Mycena vulgaris]